LIILIIDRFGLSGPENHLEHVSRIGEVTACYNGQLTLKVFDLMRKRNKMSSKVQSFGMPVEDGESKSDEYEADKCEIKSERV
jgi:hypothetical protein